MLVVSLSGSEKDKHVICLWAGDRKRGGWNLTAEEAKEILSHTDLTTCVTKQATVNNNLCKPTFEITKFWGILYGAIIIVALLTLISKPSKTIHFINFQWTFL